jgi:hypothetical protein
VLSALRRQSSADHIEPVIVLPASADVGVRQEDLDAFRHVRIVTLDAVERLAPARAAGVRAASAPIVFIGETHIYPQPGWTDALLAAFEEPWTAVVPAIGNANPTGAVSWAGYLFDYGTWGLNRRAGEMPDPLVYNTAYRRNALLIFGDQLADALDPHEEALWPRFNTIGHRAAFAPQARMLHLNVARLRWLVSEKFYVGVVLGTHRARRWAWRRRLLYIVASPLIPFVLLARVVRGTRSSRPSRLPPATFPLLLVSAISKAVGEVIGYLGVRLPSLERRLTDIEINKVRYAGRGLP